MAAPGTLLLLCVVALTLDIVFGGYVITTPREWTKDVPSQVCVYVTNPAAPAGKLTIKLTSKEEVNQVNVTFNPVTIIIIPAGKIESCYEVPVPRTTLTRIELHIFGTVDGVSLDGAGQIELKENRQITFVQTDKYLYKPGQNVKFRILTVVGANMSVSTEKYPEVWITSPSQSRIAQWKDVDNTAGLVHLDFDLADEPEEGMYFIKVKTPNGRTKSQNFKVEEFVLPRFEVQLKTPSYILATDEKFTFTVCANYTFGRPVKGSLLLTISNNKRRKCRVEITRNVTISGCRNVELTARQLKTMHCKVSFIKLSATVTEAGTGIEIKTGDQASIHRTAISFQVIHEDKYMKPNLPYTLKLRAKLPDGSPAAGVPMEVCAVGRCNNITTGLDGLFTMVLPSYDTDSVFVKALNCRAQLHKSTFSKSLEHYFSPSNSSLVIHAPEGKLKCVPGETQEHLLPLLFSANNQNSAVFTVQVISRGRVQHWSSKEYQLTNGELPISAEHLVEPLPPPIKNTIRGVVNINVKLPPTASPKVKVLVWYTREDGEVVADIRELEVEKCLGSSVNLSWSASQLEPGQQTTLSLLSEPNSVCSLGVVDRSTELLAVDHDPIALDKLFNFVDYFDIYIGRSTQINNKKYCEDRQIKEDLRKAAGATPNSGFVPRPRRRRYGYYSNYVDALKMFDMSGLYIFTDLTVETRPCEKDEAFGYPGTSGSFGSFPLPPRPPSSFGTSDQFRPTNVPFTTTTPQPFATTTHGFLDLAHEVSEEQTDAPRTNFPETWLWDMVILPPSGVACQDVTLPDTITQWVGKAVCVHPKKGVGLSQRESISTFIPFFVDLTLPPTVKRGEILPVKISIFNYLGQPIPLSVKVEESVEYEILLESGEQGVHGQRSSCLPAQDKIVHTVKIKPQQIGDINITVSAFVDHQLSDSCGSGDPSIQRSDALIKPIKVEAEGFLKENTWTKYICSKELETGEDSLETWDLAAPSAIVEGSERAWVTAVGNLLALSLENLGHLIRMPYGCGEQNMVNFVPNIFIMKYLEASNQNTPEATKKLVSFMKSGYQRELRYRHNDGSFSAFGNSDRTGSTWLTAFVLKSFAQAQDYIQIDKDGLYETRNWLLSHQGVDGCFRSVGKVFNKALKGGIEGIESPVPLTAYVMISLLEANDASCNPSYCPAAQCIRAGTSRDPYTLALKAYALALAQLPQAEAVLQQLLDQAVVDSNAMYWKLPNGPGKSNAIAVEIAGYAIMAMMTRSSERYEGQALKVIKWITTQRNGQGGFYSTQDTVVALQALALYESHLYQGPLNIVATVRATWLSHFFTITDENKLLQQLVPLPTLPTNVSVTMEGQGCAVLQAVLRYNIPEPEASDAFDLTVNTNTAPDIECVTKRITVCVAYRLPDGKSNMAVIEVDLTSGYIPEKEDLKNAVRYDPNIKRYEVDGSKVSFYLEELTARDTCANFRVIREINVENVKPGAVRVYDYYQPEFQISKSYRLPPPTECR